MAVSGASADLGRPCGRLEHAEQTSCGDSANLLAEASAAASAWMVTAADRATEWAIDPARIAEWERAKEMFARLNSRPSWKILPDSASGSQNRVVQCAFRILVYEALDRPFPTRGAPTVELLTAVARLGASANQMLVRGPVPAPFNELPVLRKALVAPPGSELAVRLAAEGDMAADVAGVRAEMAVSATVMAAQLVWSAAMALHRGLGAETALEQADAACQRASQVRLLDRLMEPEAVQPALFDCGL